MSCHATVTPMLRPLLETDLLKRREERSSQLDKRVGLKQSPINRVFSARSGSGKVLAVPRHL
jgi:hypothetical protein